MLIFKSQTGNGMPWKKKFIKSPKGDTLSHKGENWPRRPK